MIGLSVLNCEALKSPSKLLSGLRALAEDEFPAEVEAVGSSARTETVIKLHKSNVPIKRDNE